MLMLPTAVLACFIENLKCKTSDANKNNIISFVPTCGLFLFFFFAQSKAPQSGIKSLSNCVTLLTAHWELEPSRLLFCREHLISDHQEGGCAFLHVVHVLIYSTQTSMMRSSTQQ